MSKPTKTTISKKSKMIAATAFILGALAIGGTAFADTVQPTNPMSTLVSAIAQKFDLNKDEVQKVVDQVMSEQHAQVQAQHEQRFQDRVAQGVAEGKLTQAQADLLIAKEKEVVTASENLKGKTRAQRRDALNAQRADLKQWLAANNIPKEFSFFGTHTLKLNRRQQGK